MSLLQLSKDDLALYDKVIDLDDEFFPVNFTAMAKLLNIGEGPLQYLKQRPDDYKFVNQYKQRRAKLSTCAYICCDAECAMGHKLWQLLTRLDQRSMHAWPKPGLSKQ